MTTNPKEQGASHASKSKKFQDVAEVATTSPTPEEWRQFKIQEALNERRKLDRLRAESDERIRRERREWG